MWDFIHCGVEKSTEFRREGGIGYDGQNEGETRTKVGFEKNVDGRRSADGILRRSENTAVMAIDNDDDDVDIFLRIMAGRKFFQETAKFDLGY